MGRDVGYKFDNVDIKRRIYAPQGHQQLEYENIEFRKKLMEILKGEDSIKVNIVNEVKDDK
jgi:hypothetical protein